jgi:hypothetical protein
MPKIKMHMCCEDREDDELEAAQGFLSLVGINSRISRLLTLGTWRCTRAKCEKSQQLILRAGKNVDALGEVVM